MTYFLHTTPLGAHCSLSAHVMLGGKLFLPLILVPTEAVHVH